MSSIDALCSNCNQFRQLEACVHCLLPICQECAKVHVEQWRSESFKYCQSAQKKLDRYLLKYETVLDPIVKQNSDNICKVKSDIQNEFDRFISSLTRQKNELFSKLDELEVENNKFRAFGVKLEEFKEDLSRLRQSLNEEENLYGQFQNSRQEIKKLTNDYMALREIPLKIIGEYEKGDQMLLKNMEQNLFGNFLITECGEVLGRPKAFDSTNKRNLHQMVKEDNDFQQQNHASELETGNGKTHMFGTLRIQLKKLVEQFNELHMSTKSPTLELSLSLMPVCLASHQNLVYVCDELGHLQIHELAYNLMLKSAHKLPICNVKALAVNKKYVCVSYVDLSKEKLSQLSKVIKKLDKKSGILVFKASSEAVTFERLVDSFKNFKFGSPNSLVLNDDNQLFVSDKEAHCILKLDVKSGSLLQKCQLAGDQEPSGICLLSQAELVYVDSMKHEVHLVDANNLSKVIKSAHLNLADDSNVDILEIVQFENFFLVKCRSDTQIYVYDSDLSIRFSFEYENSHSMGVSLVKLTNNQFFICGNRSTLNSTHQFKLGLFSDF